MRILSVDDSSAVRSVVKQMVEVINAECLEAENGQQALELLESAEIPIDLILLDLEMPLMDGFEFLDSVKADPRFESIPIIMLTSVTQKERVIQAIRAGAKQYLTKPFTSEELLTKVLDVLGQVGD